MIKIKDIIKEHKIVMTEAFKSGKLRALTNKWRGLDSTFFAYGSKLGIEWDKITDKEIEAIKESMPELPDQLKKSYMNTFFDYFLIFD